MMPGVQAPRPGRRLLRGRQAGQATPSIVAVVSVVVIVVAMVAFFAGGDDDQPPPQARAETAATPAARTATEPEGPPTAARTPAKEKPDHQRRADRDRRSGKHKQQRDSRDRPGPTTGPPQVYVEVYNNTSISGLAASTAAELQDAGWQVVGVDNWYGDIPVSTVYHPDGLEAEAERLADELGIDRVRGAVAPMRFDRLTVILTGDTS
jgi:hypothetical protein